MWGLIYEWLWAVGQVLSIAYNPTLSFMPILFPGVVLCQNLPSWSGIPQLCRFVGFPACIMAVEINSIKIVSTKTVVIYSVITIWSSVTALWSITKVPSMGQWPGCFNIRYSFCSFTVRVTDGSICKLTGGTILISVCKCLSYPQFTVSRKRRAYILLQYRDGPERARFAYPYEGRLCDPLFRHFHPSTHTAI